MVGYSVADRHEGIAMDLPEICYARSGDVRIAYQMVGKGDLDLVWVPGFISNLELAWENPDLVRFYSRLASFSRLILFDKRGTGLSDRDAGIPSLEQRMDDVRAVMDAAGSQRAALFGASEGGAMSMLFAATYPARTRALALYGAYAQYPRSRAESEEFVEVIDRAWGTGATLRFYARIAAADEKNVRAFARNERLGATPSAAIALQRMNEEIDVRDILPAIRVPTLVLHRVGDERVRVQFGRDIADRVHGAKYVELPGIDHWMFLAELGDRVADEIEEFLTGSRHEIEPDRVLATVMFTDIVDSTKRAAELGDRAWRLLLDRHDETVRGELARFRGHEVKTLGDGFLATFDGPARAVRCASAIVDRMRPLGIDVRSGLHTGEIEIQREDIGGIAVHIAARVAEMAGTGEVLVSSTVRDLVAGSGLTFQDRGSHMAKGLSEPLRLFATQV
jgi:class 3 adenylate cyclase